MPFQREAAQGTWKGHCGVGVAALAELLLHLHEAVVMVVRVQCWEQELGLTQRRWLPQLHQSLLVLILVLAVLVVAMVAVLV